MKVETRFLILNVGKEIWECDFHSNNYYTIVKCGTNIIYISLHTCHIYVEIVKRSFIFLSTRQGTTREAYTVRGPQYEHSFNYNWTNLSIGMSTTRSAILISGVSAKIIIKHKPIKLVVCLLTAQWSLWQVHGLSRLGLTSILIVLTARKLKRNKFGMSCLKK